MSYKTTYWVVVVKRVGKSLFVQGQKHDITSKQPNIKRNIMATLTAERERERVAISPIAGVGANAGP